ncbi:MAG: Fic family protein [Gammaproteobacteria bacterium]|nr:MAG: Fic family protein [Gammaproteobacteria bacterium]
MKAFLMEPMIPGDTRDELSDLALELVSKASALAGQVHGQVREGIGDLVRSMNCYYSNLIEGHNTHPRDIEQALSDNYSQNTARRALQLEARAHIDLQRMIDKGEDPAVAPTSAEYIQWLHREFCSRLPEELLWVENPDTGKKIRVTPGEIRTGSVQVGRHLPPTAEELSAYLARFEEAYVPDRLSRSKQIIAVAASHHRLLWIHPFYDGNGRVARLMSHALLLRAGVGSSLWSVARGLARNVEAYKSALMLADEPRRGDLDGRGTLSDIRLREFTHFFLKTCIDQVDFMESLLQPSELLRRMKLYIDDEIAAGRLPSGSLALLREAFLAGELARGNAASLTGYQERRGRQILAKLLECGLLISQGPRAPVRLGFPIDVVERWFPNLYPVN